MVSAPARTMCLPLGARVNATGSRSSPLGDGSVVSWRQRGRCINPVDTMHTIHHRWRGCFLWCVLLDVRIRTSKTAIIDGTNLVPFINSRHRARTKLGRGAAAAIGCFLLCKWPFHHIQELFLLKCLFDGIGKFFRRIIVVSPRSSSLVGQMPGEVKVVSSTPRGNPLLESERVFPVRASSLLGQTGNEGKEERLAWRDPIRWCRPHRLADLMEKTVRERVIFLPTRD